MNQVEVRDISTTKSWWRWWPLGFSVIMNWQRTSAAVLANLERRILSSLRTPVEAKYVPISDGTKQIWTVSLNTGNESDATPLVMLHGMGSGVALWVLNLDHFARDRPVYAIDVLGFGQSSRVRFSSDAAQAEEEFVDSIEEWRQAVGINKMILLGHSLGGFLATSYALKHSPNIQHLILVDPWGFPERPPDLVQSRNIPTWVKVVRKVIEPFNPFAALRAAGPWGPGLVMRFKADLVRNYNGLFNDTRIADYLFHCNAQSPSGEVAFKAMIQPFGWARRPMLNRVVDIPPSISITMIHGARSWIDFSIGYSVKYLRSSSFVDMQIVGGAGHHVYADQPERFNEIVSKACMFADRHREDLPWPRRSFVASQMADDFETQRCENQDSETEVAEPAGAM